MNNFGFLAVQSSTAAGTLRVEVADSWTAWLQAGAAVFTAFALAVGAIWAFFRFRRSRTFRPRCSIELDCSLAIAKTTMLLSVDVSIINCGDTNINFGP